MSHLSELDGYIVRLQQRLRLAAWLRGAAVFTASALGATILLVLLLNHFAFPIQGVLWGRAALFLALLAAGALGIVVPLRRLTRARAVRKAEAANPDLEQRLTTFYETQAKAASPFLELLAADTLARAQHTPPAVLVPETRIFAMSGAALGCLAVLIWLIAARPGYMGYGASLLWTGPRTNAPPLYALTVTPGDATVRRNRDQLVTAHVTGMQPDRVQIFAHYQSASGWDHALMQVPPETHAAANWQFVFAGLPEDAEYYVVAGPLVSPHYKLRVIDLPSIKSIAVTYHYPKWTGMKSVNEQSGDLRAIEGTDAMIQVQTDRPLRDGLLKLNDGQTIRLTGGQGNQYEGTIHMEKDGAYHLAASQEGQEVRLSEDYFIATDKAAPPEVSVSRPSGDYRASPIEEVTVGVKAADAFGLKDMHLHYSVNGGPDHDVSLLKAPGTKEAEGSSMLPLEDFKVQPGDLVSVYATARDAHAESKTDISFIQVDPFEREFSQSQQSGGGGGAGGGGMNNQTDISRREKELIAATWKEQNNTTTTAKDAAAAGQFLSGAQDKLRDQVLALCARMQSRDLSEANQEFTDFDKDMQQAAAAMSPSAEKLRSMRWKDALPLEQKALQALLRAEATFRKIQVAFGQQGGGGGGGNTGRDLASLFDLELDTEKNQYETAQTAPPADQHRKDVEDALAKLDALARRQQDLANQQQTPQQKFQERWQQEMLRREAEQLQRQLEQLANSRQQNADGSSPQSATGQQNGSSQGSASQTGGQRSSRQSEAQNAAQSANQRIQEALNQLRSATSALRRGRGQQTRDAAQGAAEQLRQAANALAGAQQQMASGKLQSLTSEAGRLREEERRQAEKFNRLGGPSSDSEMFDENSMIARLRERDRLAADRQQLSNDLSDLQKQLRDAARELGPNQPTAAGKVRDALNGLDASDLNTRVQRSADWLRRGINPNANGTENEIAGGLQTLHQQLQQAEGAIGKDAGREKSSQSLPGQNDQSAALNQIERLRQQLQAMADSRAGNGRSGRPDPNGQPGNQQPGAANAERSAQNGSERWQSGTLNRQGGNAQEPQGGNQAGTDTRRAGQMSGDIRQSGGGAADGTVWGNINTGDNQYGQPPQWAVPNNGSGNPADTERTIEQGLRELHHLRQGLQSDPEAAKEIDELARKMRALDPKRFLGNPALVEQLHEEVLSAVDRLELQVERQAAANQPRTGKPYVVPRGYEDSVADYYRRLSRNSQVQPPGVKK